MITRQKRQRAFLIIGLFTFVTATTGLMRANGEHVQQAGELGDVRYSLLDETQFHSEHGTEWVPMDGRNINGSALCSEKGLCVLPDARGVFIRGMNLGRSANGDPDGDRALGAYQADTIKFHEHGYKEWHHNVSTGEGRYPDGLTSNSDQAPIVKTDGGPRGAETRPRNIALYTYVRISR